MKFTDEQRAAITTTDKNLIVLAGAGSGKTRVLVERYIHLLKMNPTWRVGNLVAITFTRKAADEMRDRIRRTLEFLAAQEPESRWSDLLGEMGGARIDTIHGLCTNLLRANAAYAGIDPDFEVLDEFDSKILLEETVTTVLAQLAHSNAPEMQLFNEYEDRQIVQTLTNERLLQSIPDELPDDLMAYWSTQWGAMVRSEGSRLVADIHEQGTLMPAGDRLGELWGDFLDSIAQLEKTDEAASAFALLQRISTMNFKSIRKSKKTPDHWGNTQAFDAAKTQLMRFRDRAKSAVEVIGGAPSEFDERAVILLPLWINLLRIIRNAYHDARMQRNALHFDDLEEKTHDLLTHFPEVRERYRHQEFTHLLVDEFQDTNALQWAIVKSLADLNQAGSLFVVGDQKQSIYGFRGADVSVFGRVQREIIEARGAAMNLSMSFRTHYPLVACFNELFGRLLIREDTSPVWAYQVERGRAMSAFRGDAPDDAPRLEFILIDQHHRDAYGNQIRNINNRAQQYSADERRLWEAYEIAVRIQTMIDQGRQVYDKEERLSRPLHYGDVAILFRSMTHAPLYESVFKTLGLPYETIAGRGYYARQEIWDILNLLRALQNPLDDLSLAAALRSPLFALSDDALLALRLQKDDEGHTLPLWNALESAGELVPDDAREHIHFAGGCLHQLREFSGRVLIAELIEEALDRTGYLAVLTGLPDGVRRRRNVEKLLAKARSGRQVTLSDFTQYLRDLTDHEVREGEASVEVHRVVRLMSVHASKGLEFPVVVLSDSSWERGGNSRAIVTTDLTGGAACKVYDEGEDQVIDTFGARYTGYLNNLRNDAERLRLLYVAMTRAQDYVILSGGANETNKNGWKLKGWLGQVVAALALPDELAPGMDHVYDFAWGQVRMTLPLQYPTLLNSASPADGKRLRDMTVPEGTVPQKPFLLNPAPIYPEARIPHLATTQIADLGSLEAANNAQDRRFYLERFRKQLLNNIPTPIDRVSDFSDVVNEGQVGEVVREALHHWRIPHTSDDNTLRNVLFDVAWRYHITNEARTRDAVNKAYALLQDFQHSQIYKMVESAVVVYRRLPFIYEHDGVILHGKIDVLLKTPKGRWVIVDYKTSYINDAVEAKDILGVIEDHARRYHLQLAIYAQAVQKQLGGITPETWIYYVRYNQPVRVPEEARRAMLSRNLKKRIMQAIED